MDCPPDPVLEPGPPDRGGGRVSSVEGSEAAPVLGLSPVSGHVLPSLFGIRSPASSSHGVLPKCVSVPVSKPPFSQDNSQTVLEMGKGPTVSVAISESAVPVSPSVGVQAGQLVVRRVRPTLPADLVGSSNTSAFLTFLSRSNSHNPWGGQ